jgi:hypothetical protein
MDEGIVKAGCSIDQDMLELRTRFRHLEARSRLELGELGATGFGTTGLKTLCRHIVGVDLPKSRRMSMSDWSQVPLNRAQLEYCARDAWAGAAIAASLEARNPSTFSAYSLTERLRGQRTLDELQHRQQQRKQAKNALKAILGPYLLTKKGRLTMDANLLPWETERVRQLQAIMEENRLERGQGFDLEGMGLEKMEFSTNSSAV